ncbi:unnamed protein product [Peniophora sp. CBMAI 1063]|nr:unnamed protein product [Peniophora sp. CBMAI 1063]
MPSADEWRLVPPESVRRLLAPDNMDHSSERLLALDAVVMQLEAAVPSLLAQIKRVRNNPSSLCRIPAEIICHIISFAKVDYGWPRIQSEPVGNGDDATGELGATTSSKLGWLVLTHVCSRWREVAIGSAHLWTDPSDYFALPPVLLRLILERARKLPFHLELSAISLYRLGMTTETVQMPRRDVPIEVLRFLSFTAKDFAFVMHEYLPVDSFQHLHRLTVSIFLDEGEEPALLPTAFLSCSSMTHLSLNNCLPSRWDIPLFGPRLTHLSLSYVGRPEIPHLMPSTLEFARILSTAALKVLAIDGIHLQDPPVPSPSITLPSDLCSMDVFSWRNATQHRDSLALLEKLIFQHRGIRMEVSLGLHGGDHTDGSIAYDPSTAKKMLSLTRSALHNIYRQQLNPPKHLILGYKSFLTHDSEIECSEKLAWPISTMQCMYMDIPGANSLLNFNLDVVSIDDTFLFDGGSIPFSLHDLRSVSLDSSGAETYLARDSWWRAMRQAADVHRISLYFSDCVLLLPLAGTVSQDGATVFTMFPRLKVIHVHLEEIFIDEDGAVLDEANAECTRILTVIRTIARVRREHSEETRLESLVVDSALSGWTAWDTVAVHVPVSFCQFYSPYCSASPSLFSS